MKAFIFVALVATVAARGLDLDTLRLAKERTLLSRPVVDDLLLKEQLGQRLPVERTVVGDVVDRVLPVEQKQLLVDGQEQLRGIYDVDRVLTFEEIYNTELFREYLTIPLFRQYIQYPVFQRYIASVYFQKFWQIPTFRQYFLNPVYFYKYIYPLVQLFTNEYTLPYQQQQQSIYGQDVYGQQDILGRQTYDDLIVRNKNVLPYVYGQQQQDVISSRYGLPTVAGQYYPTTQGVNYKFLLEKLYKNLFLNQQQVVGDVTQVKTDVKVLPTTQKVVVEPITGERQIVEQPKIVDVKVSEQVVPVEQLVTPVQQLPIERRQFQGIDSVVERQLIREQLLKDLVKEKYLTPEVYQTITRDIPFITRDIPTVTRDLPFITREGRQSIFDSVDTPIVGRREVYTPSVNRQFQGERYQLINKLYNQLYNQEIPAIRENTVYDRLPIQQQLQQVLGNIVA